MLRKSASIFGWALFLTVLVMLQILSVKTTDRIEREQWARVGVHFPK
jgi:hypothetical protein